MVDACKRVTATVSTMREYSLDVIKNGVLVERILHLQERIARAKDEVVIVGRDPPSDDGDDEKGGENGACHVRVEHASISRNHLAVRRRNDAGVLEVEDLESVHGSFMNGKKLIARERYVLRDGDVLQFGASTRRYLVIETNRDDDDDDDDDNDDDDKKGMDKPQPRPLPIRQQEQQQQQRRQQQKEEEDTMRAQREADAMLSAMEYDDEGRFKWMEYLARYQGTLSFRQQRIVDNLCAKEMRIRNLMKEVGNIERKADEKGAMTEGQRRQRYVIRT